MRSSASRRPKALSAIVAATLAVALALPAASAAAGEAPPAPANDTIAAAQAVHALPATFTGTTVGATVEPVTEPPSACGATTEHSVWYSVRPGTAERIGVNLTAGGSLDATVDVYHAVRSQLTSVVCQQTDAEGHESLSFAAARNGLYYIRVASLFGSSTAAFTLEVFLPKPPVEPPGAALPGGGASGEVDRVQNINAAYHVTLRAGTSYLINLANETPHACVSAVLFAPGIRSFEDEGSSLLHIDCGGYRLFTPGPGGGGRYVIELTPRESDKGVQRYHLQVGVAGAAETAPGIPLANYQRAYGSLDGRGVRVLRLYRLDIHDHSNLTLRLHAPESAKFNLQLRDSFGHVIGCQCEGSGDQTLQQQLSPGRYYAVVSERAHSAGGFSLTRESRTITSSSISFSSRSTGAGQGVSINVKVSPAEAGPVTIDIERFSPVFGWQFYREQHLFASGGVASTGFTPPAVGRWRVSGSYGGSRTASPSGAGTAYLLAT